MCSCISVFLDIRWFEGPDRWSGASSVQQPFGAPVQQQGFGFGGGVGGAAFGGPAAHVAPQQGFGLMGTMTQPPAAAARDRSHSGSNSAAFDFLKIG